MFEWSVHWLTLVKMHRTVLLVVVLICGLTEAFHNPEKEAIRNRIAVQQRLDYIKRYCPIAEQYDTMVVECK